jgi:putative sterol carrier protein
MAIEFGTQEWADAMKDALNNSAAYKKEAQKWEGDMCFVAVAGDGLETDLVSYFDLWHGACRDAKAVPSGESVSSAFTISAALPVWKLVVAGELDPIAGLTSRKLKLKGNMLKILRTPKAAIEMVNCAKSVDTSWPA